MHNLIPTLSTGLTAFSATNLDDIVILLLFFSQVNAVLRRRHIVLGQYLGFTALVLASLPGFFSSLIIPRAWIGILGLVPIGIGLSRIFGSNETDEVVSPETVSSAHPPASGLAHWLSPSVYSVAAVTVANGGDNVGIYAPLFANSAWDELMAMLSIFFTLVGIWCYIACQLTRLPAIAPLLTRYGNQLVPFVLIGLGGLILVDSHTLESRGLVTLVLVISGLMLLMLLRSLEHPSIVNSELEEG